MTDRLTIEIGIPGQSDLVLYELENAARQIGRTPQETAIFLIGLGLGVAEGMGLVTRSSPAGAGLDPDWRPPKESDNASPTNRKDLTIPNANHRTILALRQLADELEADALRELADGRDHSSTSTGRTINHALSLVEGVSDADRLRVVLITGAAAFD